MVDIIVRPATRPSIQNVVQTLNSYGRFNNLIAALRAAGLEDALNGPGPFTVFAPTDEAFAKLEPGKVDDLLQDPKGQLKDILKYHIIQDNLSTDDLTDKDSVETCQGSDLNIEPVDKSRLAEMTSGVESTSATHRVNEGHVIIPDIRCSNGMIHAIDTVLMPPQS